MLLVAADDNKLKFLFSTRVNPLVTIPIPLTIFLLFFIVSFTPSAVYYYFLCEGGTQRRAARSKCRTRESESMLALRRTRAEGSQEATV